MEVLQLKSEAVASQEFFSPVRLNYPLVLTRQGLLMEVYSISSSIEIQKIIQYTEGNSVYDYHWVTPTTYIVLVKDHPIVLRSSSTGKILQKYPIYNHLNEIKSPYTSCISDSHILTILGNNLHKIDLASSTHTTHPIKLPQFRPRTVTNSISTNSSITAIGSYNTSSYLIDNNTQKPIKKLSSLNSVNQFIFSQYNLYIGAVHSEFIQIWDLRQLNSTLIDIPRYHPTHQKTLFDVDSNSNLGIGNGDGSICVYNPNFQLRSQFYAHFDAVNSVQFYEHGLVTSSGQRHLGKIRPKSLIREFIW